MAEKQKARKPGRHGRYQRYATGKTREKNKTVRVFESSGLPAALDYATGKGISGWAKTRLAQRRRNPRTQ